MWRVVRAPRLTQSHSVAVADTTCHQRAVTRTVAAAYACAGAHQRANASANGESVCARVMREMT
jgi:hypothetical protein